MSVHLSFCLSVRLKLKISVITEPIGLYSSGNMPTGPVVVLSYFLEGWTLPPQKKKNFFLGMVTLQKMAGPEILYFFLQLPLGAKPLEARGEAASIQYSSQGINKQNEFTIWIQFIFSFMFFLSPFCLILTYSFLKHNFFIQKKKVDNLFVICLDIFV